MSLYSINMSSKLQVESRLAQAEGQVQVLTPFPFFLFSSFLRDYILAIVTIRLYSRASALYSSSISWMLYKADYMHCLIAHSLDPLSRSSVSLSLPLPESNAKSKVFSPKITFTLNPSLNHVNPYSYSHSHSR